MSTILGSVTMNTHTAGSRIVIAGAEKVGKSTLVAGAPGVLFIPLEVGYQTLKVQTTPMLTYWEHVQQLMIEIKQQAQTGQFPYKTLVFDSATALERLIHDATLRRDPAYSSGNKKALTMESALGGYGRAYQYANELFDWFLKSCDELALNAKINIVLTCHVFASEVIDPTHGKYDCWDLLLHSPKNQKAYGKREMLTQWADMIGFLYEPLFVTNSDDGMSRAVSANKGRVLGVSRTPSYVAGNRFGLTGEIQIPEENGWNYLADAIYKKCGIDLYKR